MKTLIIEYRDITHPEAGGAEIVLLEVFKRIVAAGHQVDYLCNQHRGAKSEEMRDGLRIIRRGHQPYFNWHVPHVYRSELRANGYDLIIEGIDKLPFFMPLVERRVPVLCIVPHLFGTTVFREAPLPVGAYVYALERFIPRVYGKCLFSVLSHGTRDDLIRRGIPAENVQIIYSGLSQERYSAPHEKPVADPPVLVYVGRVKRYKGIEYGIQAVGRLRKKYPAIQCLIAGTGDYLGDLQRMTARLGLTENVRFLGYIPEKEKVEILQKASVLLYTSPKEGWGLAVIEANVCGTPVVASDSPGLRESVVNGETGFLVPHGNVEALARRIDELLSDRALYLRMRAAAIEWGSRFTWERSARETMELMERAAGRAARSAHD